MLDLTPEPPLIPPEPEDEPGHWSYGVWIPDWPEDDWRDEDR